MSDLAALLAQVRANPRDDACWLVIADRLTEENNPLGEYIVLSLKYQGRSTPELKKRRMRKLGRDWQARYAPTATFVSWHRSGLKLRFASTEDVFSHAEELRRIGLPLVLEVAIGKSSPPDLCFFDADFTRLAWMHASMTITNQNHSPGMDEEYHHDREVVVWRVADREVLLKRSVEGEWRSLEFRADGVYALEGERAVRLTLS